MSDTEARHDETGDGRRGFLATTSAAAMGVSLCASYGTFAFMLGRFLYPAKGTEKRWLLVTDVDSVPAGSAIRYRDPAGATITIARRGEGRETADFLALSSVCPHLGCRVHWEGQNERFFCPCHNGIFDPDGKPVSGPPAEAGQELPRFPLKVEGNLLYIEVAVERLDAGKSGGSA